MENLKILHLLVDDTGDNSFFRILVNNKDFKYLTIDFGVYAPSDMVWRKMILPQLPPLPAGDWNLGHVTKTTENPKPHFDWAIKKDFSSAGPAWHPITIDYLSLNLDKMCMPNVYEATLSQYFNNTTIIAKFATFPFETAYYTQETLIYSWLTKTSVAPKFLGHIAENGRLIGFILAKIDGARHPDKSNGDAIKCRKVLGNLHELGILHGDLNKYNFLVKGDRAWLIDFESSRKVEEGERGLLAAEMGSLAEFLQSDSKKGSQYRLKD